MSYQIQEIVNGQWQERIRRLSGDAPGFDQFVRDEARLMVEIVTQAAGADPDSMAKIGMASEEAKAVMDAVSTVSRFIEKRKKFCDEQYSRKSAK